MKKLFSFNKVLVLALVFAMLMGAGSVFAWPWKFGLISDTQWTKQDDGKDPNTCAADIIKQVNQQFIAQAVKLVIAVGDTVDVGSKISIDTRALYAQDLYNAGIGFYPLRGNHEAAEDPNYLLSGLEFQYAFPQIGTGLNNNTPGDITTALATLIPAADLGLNPPALKTGTQFKVGDKFSAPTAVNKANNSISYSFDYNNTRFVLLDQFDVTGNYYYSTIPAQQPWIYGQLSDHKRPQHAFVFAHKNLLGGNHKDNMFGGPASANDPGDGDGVDPNTQIPNDKITLKQKQQAEDAFISALAQNNVRFSISGHDHHHYHSIVSSPLTPGMSVHQLITQSDSSKFYTPALPVSTNDLPVSQDLYRVGYYIFTVDGPRVNVDYYASDYSYPSAFSRTPTFNFVKRDSFGYSLNGKEFLIAQGKGYASVQDSFLGTTAMILSGTNGSTAKTNYNKPLTKAVDTGWTSMSDAMETKCHKVGDDEILASNVLTLWGMADLGTDQTDTYTLSMSYDSTRVEPLHLGSGGFGIATRNEDGGWINAVDMNFGGTKKFVWGAWNPNYKLGTYGLDPHTHTAWAVINYNGDFAVAGFEKHQDQDSPRP
jgi:hypothetical protein